MPHRISLEPRPLRTHCLMVRSRHQNWLHQSQRYPRTIICVRASRAIRRSRFFRLMVCLAGTRGHSQTPLGANGYRSIMDFHTRHLFGWRFGKVATPDQSPPISNINTRIVCCHRFNRIGLRPSHDDDILAGALNVQKVQNAQRTSVSTFKMLCLKPSTVTELRTTPCSPDFRQF